MTDFGKTLYRWKYTVRLKAVTATQWAADKLSRPIAFFTFSSRKKVNSKDVVTMYNVRLFKPSSPSTRKNVTFCFCLQSTDRLTFTF